MKYTVKPSTIFQKDLKRVEKRGYHLALLAEVIKMLANDEELPTKTLKNLPGWSVWRSLCSLNALLCAN